MSAKELRTFVSFIVATGIVAQIVFGIDALPLAIRVALLLIGLGFAPGILVVEWFLGQRYGNNHAAWTEKALYGVGVGYLLWMTSALTLSFLPGGIAPWQAFVIPNVVMMVAAAALWRRSFVGCPPPAPWPGGRSLSPVDASPWSNQRVFWMSVLLVLAIGTLPRMLDLGYSEFQGDEARVMLRASEVIEGYENALFLHEKMPGEILAVSLVYAATQRMDESAARLPFTLAGIAALVGVLLLGARLFGPIAGAAAGILAALTGYFVAFARIVQYQSLVLLAVVLSVLVLWQMLSARRDLWRYLSVAALLMAMGVLAHYEAVGILPVVVYLLWRLLRSGVGMTTLLRSSALPLLLFATPILFYLIPFVKNPDFATAYAYAVGYRIDPGGYPYNNLIDFFQRASLYGTAYYLIWMLLLTFGALVSVYRHNFPKPLVWVFALIAGSGLLLTFLQPSWLVLGGVDHTWAFFALLVLVPLIAPNVSVAERLIWWWFGSLMVFALFFVQRPNSHVYTFFIPWVLLGGMVLARVTEWSAHRFPAPAVRTASLTVGVALILIFGLYLHRLFVYNDVEVLRLWPQYRPTGYWMPFDSPPEVAIFGFPHNSGWKVIGAQYANQSLAGNFLTNEKPEVVDWYTQGAGSCPRGNRYYIVASRTEPQADAAAQALVDEVGTEYSLQQVVMVEGESKLHLFERNGEPRSQQIDLADFAHFFDQELSDPSFVDRRGRILAPTPQHQRGYGLGDAIQLIGFDLDVTETTPGGILHLTLYWHALRSPQNTYTVFNQVIDPVTAAKAGQVDGMPVCDRNPTNEWSAGDFIADPYVVEISPDAVPGVYTLITGLYDPVTGERLAVTAPDGADLGAQAPLASIKIGRFSP